MLSSLFFYGLLVLPAAMALVAVAVAWSSLAHPLLFALTAFLALLGLQSVVRWATRLSLHNFAPVGGVAQSKAGEDPPVFFLLSYYGSEAVLLLVLGSLLLRWLWSALGVQQ
jgi:hypothetical protein